MTASPDGPSAGQRGAQRLARRKVLVVGGGGTAAGPGNGYAISVLAAREGAAVAVADIDAGAAGITTAAAGGQAVAVLADVRRPGDCERLVLEANAALGGLDGLVLNVGTGRGLGLAGTDSSAWDEVMAVNLRSHFLVVRAALPLMSGGAIVLVVDGGLGALPPPPRSAHD